MDPIAQVILVGDWLNANEGVVSVLLFLITLFLGWISGIFGSLRRRPRLRVSLIEGPTLCSTFPTGEKFGAFDVHRTAVALYLHVANVGSAPTSLESVSIGYHWTLKPFGLNWFRYRIFWFWLHDQIAALTDFHVQIGDNVKVYPFLFQRNAMGGKASTYLEVGRSVNGIVYFEQSESWGGCFPLQVNGRTRIVVAVVDVLGKKHKKRFWVPVVSLADAKKYNPSFGETFPALKRGPRGDEKPNPPEPTPPKAL